MNLLVKISKVTLACASIAVMQKTDLRRIIKGPTKAYARLDIMNNNYAATEDNWNNNWDYLEDTSENQARKDIFLVSTPFSKNIGDVYDLLTTCYGLNFSNFTKVMVCDDNLVNSVRHDSLTNPIVETNLGSGEFRFTKPLLYDQVMVNRAALNNFFTEHICRNTSDKDVKEIYFCSKETISFIVQKILQLPDECANYLQSVSDSVTWLVVDKEGRVKLNTFADTLKSNWLDY